MFFCCVNVPCVYSSVDEALSCLLPQFGCWEHGVAKGFFKNLFRRSKCKHWLYLFIFLAFLLLLFFLPGLKGAFDWSWERVKHNDVAKEQGKREKTKDLHKTPYRSGRKRSSNQQEMDKGSNRHFTTEEIKTFIGWNDRPWRSHQENADENDTHPPECLTSPSQYQKGVRRTTEKW